MKLKIIFSALLSLVVLEADKLSFPRIFNSQEEEIPFMKPMEALETIKLPEGFKASLFASEPDVQQPIGITFDSRGRLWVAENYTYSEASINYHMDLRDRIIILEDTNGDGRADNRKVFGDQFQKLTSLLPAFGGVYVLCPPELLFVPDADGDDLPDGPPQVLLDGFDHDKIRHTLANGLKLGPDGWIYGRHGIQGTSFIGRPGTPHNERIPVNAAIWRFHPVSRKFELVAQGTTNPWGSDWDAHGELFFINTVIGHLWHAIPGAWFKRMYGEPFNPHLYELIDQVADHVHWDTREAWHDINNGITESTMGAGGGHAHTGLLIYQGDNWPEEYRNRMFTLNYHGKRINSDRISREGAGYTASHAPDFLSSGDPYFRGIDLLSGPEGGVYLADWSDIGECHDNNGIHRTSGRIYRITFGKPTRRITKDLKTVTTEELVQLQFDPNEWLVRQARQVLQERAIQGVDLNSAKARLQNELQQRTNSLHKLRALWALHVIDGTSHQLLESLLAESNEHLRVWAIRLLLEHGAPPAQLISRFVRLAETDPSGLVLAYSASSLQRIPPTNRWELASALLQREQFGNDKTLPLLIWYGIEAAVSADPAKAVNLAARSRMPKVTGLITRRIFQDLQQYPSAADAILQLLELDAMRDHQMFMLQGMSRALEHQSTIKAPPAWTRVAPALIQNPDSLISSLALELDALFGSSQSQLLLLKLMQNPQADAARRRRALDILLKVQPTSFISALEQLLSDSQLSSDAVRALTRMDPEKIAPLLSRYSSLPEPAKRELINTAVSRPASALALLAQIQRGQIRPQEIGSSQLRQLRGLEQPQLKEKLSRIWPEADDSPHSRKHALAKYKSLLSLDNIQKADLSSGRTLYLQVCAPCHKLYGEGSEIGPELTGSDRKNLDYLLENILNPSLVVPDNYRMSIINMADDQVLTGVIVSKTNQSLILQTHSERMVLPLDQIDAIQESELSMMPDGLLDALQEQQVTDLIAYLMSSAPPRPPER